jgi:2,3-bisphosphoglycerate-dependent phosphoglycerate mutase
VILLVRHAQPVAPGDPRYPENDRPLSPLGRRQAEQLRDELAGEEPAAIYSSPYPRALHTVEPLARLSGLDVTIVDDLRERLLSVEPMADWRERLRQSWRDFSLEVGGGESSAGAQLRVRTVLDELATRHDDDHRRRRQPRQPDRAGVARDRPRPGRLRLLGADADARRISAGR